MGKRIFDTYHAPNAETEGVKAALQAANIAYYETHKGKWGVGSAALWVCDPADYQAARAVIDKFQAEWLARIREEYATAPPQKIRWARIPPLLLVLAIVLYLTFFWYP